MESLSVFCVLGVGRYSRMWHVRAMHRKQAIAVWDQAFSQLLLGTELHHE